MQKLDKKQMPQFVGLCVLSTGVFGYFGMRMVTPSPAAAATRPVPKPMAAISATAPAAARAADTAPAETLAAPPPAPGMRDPFVVGYTDPKSVKAAAPAAFTAPPPGPAPAAGTPAADTQIHEQVASLPPAPISGLTVPGFPAAPPLPPSALPPSQKTTPSEKIMPLPAPPPAPPKWTVTGLLQSETGGVAILRDGDSRRFVRVGDFVDGLFRVANVTRSSVVLRHGKTFYTLPLSAAAEKPKAKAVAAPAPAAPVSLPAPAAVPAPPAPMLPRQSQAAPARRLTANALPESLPLRLLDGTEMTADAPAQIASRLR